MFSNATQTLMYF